MDPRGEDIRAFRRSLRLLEREIGFSLSAETDCCGVSPAQCHLILEAEERPEAGVQELASLLELDKSTLSRTVEFLRKAGLLSRKSDPGNRRRVVIRLTGEGERMAHEINRLCDESCAEILERIPEGKRPSVVETVGLLAEAMRGYRKEGVAGRAAGGSRCPGKED